MTTPRPNSSPMDEDHLALLRANVESFMTDVAETYAANGPALLLDIAPQDHQGARPFFSPSVRVETLDIDPAANADYTADICGENGDLIAAGRFDFVVCTEVLEHTLDPFAAVREMGRVLNDGGLLFLSTPFNIRIHGPLPDCWRFTEHGLRALLGRFDILTLDELATADRPLMPIQYTVVARKK